MEASGQYFKLSLTGCVLRSIWLCIVFTVMLIYLWLAVLKTKLLPCFVYCISTTVNCFLKCLVLYYRQIYFWWWDQKCLKRTKLDLCCFFSLPTIDIWISNACKSMTLCMHPLCDSECCAVKDWVIVNKFYVNVNNQFLSQNQINICVQTPAYAIHYSKCKVLVSWLWSNTAANISLGGAEVYWKTLLLYSYTYCSDMLGHYEWSLLYSEII